MLQGKTEASTVLEKKTLSQSMVLTNSLQKQSSTLTAVSKNLNFGADKILAVGFDSGALQQDAIRKGIFVGSVTQDPVQIGLPSC